MERACCGFLSLRMVETFLKLIHPPCLVLYNDYLVLHLIFWRSSVWYTTNSRKPWWIFSNFKTFPTSHNVPHHFRSNAGIYSSDTLTEGEDFNLFSTGFIGFLLDIVCRRWNYLYMVSLQLLYSKIVRFDYCRGRSQFCCDY